MKTTANKGIIRRFAEEINDARLMEHKRAVNLPAPLLTASEIKKITK